jgi:hypothetical protein
MSSFIEGGGEFIDYRDPNNIFKTRNPNEWDKHLRETKATKSGYEPCAICNTVTQFTDLEYVKKPVCDNCKEDLK